MIQTEAFDLIISKRIDEITITDVENALSGSSALADEIIAVQLEDDITITKVPPDSLTN